MHMAEENQDMEMEEILSSIKDILENDEQTTVNEVTPQSEASVAQQADLSAEDDDVIELSPNMRIEENPSEEVSLPENISFNEEPANETIIEETLSDTVAVDENLSMDETFDTSANSDDSTIFNQTDTSDDNINIETDSFNEDTVLDDINVDDLNIEAFDDISEDTSSSISLEDELADDISSITQEAEINIDEENSDSEFLLDETINQEEVVLDTNDSIAEDFNLNTPQIEEVNIDEPIIENNIADELNFSETENSSYSEPESSVEIPVSDYNTEEHTSDKVTDISANIISNFAKMFSREEKQEPVTKVETPETIKPTVGGHSLEDFVFEIIKNGITNEMNAQLNSPEFKALINSEVNRQVASWINENLPTLVEKVVKREIERVVAKAGV